MMSTLFTTGRRAGAVVVAMATFATAGCGATYVNDAATATTADDSAPTSTTLPPIPADASVDQLMAELADRLGELGHAVIDQRNPGAIRDRINEIWAALKPKLDDDPIVAENIGTAVELANTAVDRKRAADADKALKIVDDQIKQT